MKVQDVKDILKNYLEVYEEKDRQKVLLDFLDTFQDGEINDWNNFVGHLVASGFVYSKADKKFLVLFHKDMKMYLYPGGHIDDSDESVLTAAQRETMEETGISDFAVYMPGGKTLPIDIDTHIVPYNKRLDLPEHLHFDFRYLFVVDSMSAVVTDEDEMGDYKWVELEELKSNDRLQIAIQKLAKIIK